MSVTSYSVLHIEAFFELNLCTYIKAILLNLVHSTDSDVKIVCLARRLHGFAGPTHAYFKNGTPACYNNMVTGDRFGASPDMQGCKMCVMVRLPTDAYMQPKQATLLPRADQEVTPLGLLP